jgi:hypothetical protein
MPNGNYAGELLNLTDDYLFAGFYDGDKQLMGKVIKVKGDNKGKSWKPANLTTALLLYLLRRQDDDCIPYDEFKQLIYKKFNNVDDAKIDAALDWFKKRGALDQKGPKTPTTNPDPSKVFDPTQPDFKKVDWNPVGLNDAKDAPKYTQHKIAYSSGYYMITVWK